MLQDLIGKEQRPLSWTIGPQGVVKPVMPVMRDLKREQRRLVTELPLPDKI